MRALGANFSLTHWGDTNKWQDFASQASLKNCKSTIERVYRLTLEDIEKLEEEFDRCISLLLLEPNNEDQSKIEWLKWNLNKVAQRLYVIIPNYRQALESEEIRREVWNSIDRDLRPSFEDFTNSMIWHQPMIGVYQDEPFDWYNHKFQISPSVDISEEEGSSIINTIIVLRNIVNSILESESDTINEWIDSNFGWVIPNLITVIKNPDVPIVQLTDEEKQYVRQNLRMPDNRAIEMVHSKETNSALAHKGVNRALHHIRHYRQRQFFDYLLNDPEWKEIVPSLTELLKEKKTISEMVDLRNLYLDSQRGKMPYKHTWYTFSDLVAINKFYEYPEMMKNTITAYPEYIVVDRWDDEEGELCWKSYARYAYILCNPEWKSLYPDLTKSLLAYLQKESTTWCKDDPGYQLGEVFPWVQIKLGDLDVIVRRTNVSRK